MKKMLILWLPRPWSLVFLTVTHCVLLCAYRPPDRTKYVMNVIMKMSAVTFILGSQSGAAMHSNLCGRTILSLLMYIYASYIPLKLLQSSGTVTTLWECIIYENNKKAYIKRKAILLVLYFTCTYFNVCMYVMY